MPLFHEKISEVFTRALTDISGNGSQQDELQFARTPLNFSREIEWSKTDLIDQKINHRF